nr:TetR/AcrR family transcriptional regulator [Sphingomonas sp. Y57]
MTKKRATAGRDEAAEEIAEEAGNAADGPDRANRQRGALVRKAMLNAAAQLFAERGFGGTNLRDLADVLGISRPGLYYHFPNKEKILEALIEEVTLSSAAQLAEVVEKVERDPEDALRLVMRTVTNWVLENPVLFRVLDRSEADMPAELKERHAVSKKAILESFTGIIERGIAVGKFRPVDAHVAALSIIGMRNWAAWWFNPNGRMPKDEIADMIADMAVRSLLRPDAHRSRSDRIQDVLRILKEDVAHLDHLLKD